MILGAVLAEGGGEGGRHGRGEASDKGQGGRAIRDHVPIPLGAHRKLELSHISAGLG